MQHADNASSTMGTLAQPHCNCKCNLRRMMGDGRHALMGYHYQWHLKQQASRQTQPPSIFSTWLNWLLMSLPCDTTRGNGWHCVYLSQLVRLPQSEKRTDDNAQATQSWAEVITAIEMLQRYLYSTAYAVRYRCADDTAWNWTIH